MMRNLPRRWILWVAAMAVLLGSLAPGISRMLTGLRQQQVAWVEVCTAQGAQLVAVAEPASRQKPSPQQQQQMHGESHCPFQRQRLRFLH